MKQYNKSFVVKISAALVGGTAVLTAFFVSVMFLGAGFLGNFPSALKMGRIKRLIQSHYLEEYDPKLLQEGAYYGMALTLGDPYSGYVSQDDMEALKESISGEYVGIGVEITVDSQDGMITVIAPIDGSPADMAGVRTGDKLTQINGQDITGMELDQVVSMLRNGKEKEEIELTLLRDGEQLSLTVIRDHVVIHSAKGFLLEDGVGYLKLSSFDDTTVNEFSQVLSQLEQEGATSLVLDLRGNPGGTVEAAQSVADVFLDQGIFYCSRDKNGKQEFVYTKEGKDDIPMAVLINNGSASASEMLAGALQDRGRAVLVGATTFGKGIMQEYFPVDRNSMLKLTTHEFLTPNEHQIHEKGISPDVEVEMDPAAELGNMESDVQLQKAVSLLLE